MRRSHRIHTLHLLANREHGKLPLTTLIICTTETTGNRDLRWGTLFTSCCHACGYSWLECTGDMERATLTTASLLNLAWFMGSKPLETSLWNHLSYTHIHTIQSSPNICITEIKRTMLFLQNNLTITFFSDFSVPALHLFFTLHASFQQNQGCKLLRST